jgi:hypothetical protein
LLHRNQNTLTNNNSAVEFEFANEAQIVVNRVWFFRGTVLVVNYAKNANPKREQQLQEKRGNYYIDKQTLSQSDCDAILKCIEEYETNIEKYSQKNRPKRSRMIVFNSSDSENSSSDEDRPEWHVYDRESSPEQNISTRPFRYKQGHTVKIRSLTRDMQPGGEPLDMKRVLKWAMNINNERDGAKYGK